MTAKQVTTKLLEDGGVDVERLTREVEEYLGKQPKVSGDTSQQKSLGRTLGEVFQAGRGVRDGLQVRLRALFGSFYLCGNEIADCL